MAWEVLVASLDATSHTGSRIALWPLCTVAAYFGRLPLLWRRTAAGHQHGLPWRWTVGRSVLEPAALERSTICPCWPAAAVPGHCCGSILLLDATSHLGVHIASCPPPSGSILGWLPLPWRRATAGQLDGVLLWGPLPWLRQACLHI